MNKKFILVAALAFVVLSASSVSAATTRMPRATAAQNLQTIISAADKAITNRITSMNNLITRINTAQKITADQKTTIITNLQNEISQMNTLKSKIDADTDVTTARADAKTITGSYRIYALVNPQARITAYSDRAMTIVSLLNGLAGVLQTRIAALPAGATATAAQQLLTDLNAKTTDANTLAQAAVSEISGLVPDNGVATVMASNNAALKDARSKMKAIQADFVAARKDAGTIASDIKSAKTASAGSSLSTSSTPQ